MVLGSPVPREIVFDGRGVSLIRTWMMKGKASRILGFGLDMVMANSWLNE